MQHIEFERLAQAVGRKVARRVMARADTREQARQHREFAGEQGLENPALGLLQDGGEPGRQIADLPPHLIERFEALAVDQYPGDGIEPFIAGGAVDAGEGRQLFLFSENLFDHHVERFGILSLCIPDQAAQALKILRRIAQTIDVIEPQAVQPAFRDQLFHQAMDGVERAGILDPQSG